MKHNLMLALAVVGGSVLGIGVAAYFAQKNAPVVQEAPSES